MTAVTVDQVGGERSFRRRLLELGLVPGTKVQVVAVAPLGDPLKLLVRGSNLSIRRAEAQQIRVSAPSLAPGTEAPPAVVPVHTAGHAR